MPVCRIHSSSEIEALREKTGLFKRPAFFRVELLAANALSPGRRKTLERRLAFALSDCGCALASAAMILIPVLLFLAGDVSPLPVWPNTVFYIASAGAGAVLAKLISLFFSFHLANRTIDELQDSLLPQQAAADTCANRR